jgi:NhaP-type Na+/H+ or K+/H+ antiporter
VAELLVISLAIFGYALVSERLAMSPISAPMVFVTVGLVVGTAGLGVFDLGLDNEAVSVVVEATLVVVLFTDAVRIDLRALRQSWWLPGRLLGVGLPLTLVLGTVAALVLLPDLTIAEAALVAAVLAPTDAALGQAVVSDMRLPVRLRQGINVESGLNDGIALPVVTICLAWAGAEADADGFAEWGTFVAQQIGLGVLCGLAVGAGGAWLLRRRSLADRVEGIYRQLATISIAAAAFATASLIDGNGFIAAFTAGLAFGHLARERCRGIQDFTADQGELLSVVTFTIFGAAIAGPLLDELTLRVAGYVVLSLTVVRMAPVLLSLWRSGMLLETRAFAAWFGPRGLASILFALLVFEELEGPGAQQVFLVATWTVLVSVYAHGLSAAPWSSRLSRRLGIVSDDAPELAPVAELPTRR